MVATTDRVPRIAAVVGFFLCLGFAAATHHAWEDYLITFRASLNLATGHGLVFQPGERVHSFTSPLGTLLPALFALGDGPGVELRALWWFRLASALVLGAALGLAAREFCRDRLVAWSAAVACGLWAFDPKIVDFSTNGMESALVIFFVVLTWRALVRGARLWPLALGCAGLQWTRPDGCVFFAALALAWLAGGETPAGEPARRSWPAVARAVVLGVVLYLPWLLFAWSYYGSPIPHTIVAKQLAHPLGETAVRLALYPLRLLGGHVALHDLFMPAYFYFGGWPAGLAWFSRLLAVAGALAWLCPGIKPAGRVASAALCLGGFYLEYIPGSPWYFPGWQVLACIAWGYLLDALASRLGNKGIVPLRMTALLLVAVQLTLLLAVAWQMRLQQKFIEDDHRHTIGLWLRSHAGARDRVYLEPLGYIGYYSGLKMLDNPGLCAPEVVAVRHAGRTSHAQIIASLQPEWLVLRPDQVQSVQESAPGLLTADYRIAQVFDTRSRLNAVRFLPGRGYLDFDAVFLVYHRASAGSPHAGR